MKNGDFKGINKEISAANIHDRKRGLGLRINKRELKSEIKDLKIIVVNCRSIRNKQAEFVNLAKSSSADVILGTESWLCEEIASSEIFPPDYIVYRKDRTNRIGGGVFIAVKDHLDIQPEDIIDTTSEMVWCSILGKNRSKILFCSFYRPPEEEIHSIEDLSESLRVIRDKMKDHIIVVGGDFNLPHIDWENVTHSSTSAEKKLSQKLIDTFTIHGLEQVNMNITRTNRTGKGNILDLLATSHPQLMTSIHVADGISDHDVIIAELKAETIKTLKPRRDIYLFSKCNFTEFKIYINEGRDEFLPLRQGEYSRR